MTTNRIAQSDQLRATGRFIVYGAYGEASRALSAHPTLAAAARAHSRLSWYERDAGAHSARVADSADRTGDDNVTREAYEAIDDDSMTDEDRLSWRAEGLAIAEDVWREYRR